MVAIGFEVTQVGQRQQMAARRGTRQAGAFGRERGVEPLAFGIETFQHREALAQSGDVVGGRNGRKRGRGGLHDDLGEIVR
ncbi:hypothetical protein D3C71_2087140 [compost metagenome]